MPRNLADFVHRVWVDDHDAGDGLVLLSALLAGAIGALIAAYALYVGSFGILLVGSFITGIYMSAQVFYRFAATDTASEAFRPKAISYVIGRRPDFQRSSAHN